MNSVERVRSICKERKIPISKLEKDLGFSNGYIGQLKKGVFPADRLDLIAQYLLLTTEYLMYGSSGKENTPSELVLTEGERELIEIFRLIPAEQQRHFLEMGRAYADSLRKA